MFELQKRDLKASFQRLTRRIASGAVIWIPFGFGFLYLDQIVWWEFGDDVSRSLGLSDLWIDVIALNNRVFFFVYALAILLWSLFALLRFKSIRRQAVQVSQWIILTTAVAIPVLVGVFLYGLIAQILWPGPWFATVSVLALRLIGWLLLTFTSLVLIRSLTHDDYGRFGAIGGLTLIPFLIAVTRALN